MSPIRSSLSLSLALSLSLSLSFSLSLSLSLSPSLLFSFSFNWIQLFRGLEGEMQTDVERRELENTFYREHVL
jgi:hypothetical protein